MKRSLAPTPISVPPSVRRVSFDSLVHGSMVDLFSAYEVALAPLATNGANAGLVPEVSVAVAFTPQKHGERGRLTLSLPAALLDQMKESENTSVKLDWARELTNQLMGRIKNRLLPYGFPLDVGVLSLIERHRLDREINDRLELRVYAARSMRGMILVTIQGMPRDAELAYVGNATASEGSLIWF